MSTIYEYRLSGRRPAIWMAAAVFLFMGGLMASHGTAFVIWLPVILGGGMIIWALLRNPQTGLRITEMTLILSPWQNPRPIPLSEIEAVKLHAWSDSTDMHIWLKSGATARVSSMDIPPVEPLRSVLAPLGIPILET